MSWPDDHRLKRYLTALIIVSLAFKVGIVFWLKQLNSLTQSRSYSYIGADYPREWPIERPTVKLAFEHPLRYKMDAAEEWASSVGPKDGLVYLGEERRPFTVGMIHQLRCLDIVRDGIVLQTAANGTRTPTKLQRHCLNYIRQMITCRPDTYLESFQYPGDPHAVDLEAIYECKDWGAVYRAMKAHQ